jgi:hypothetical protein
MTRIDSGGEKLRGKSGEVLRHVSIAAERLQRDVRTIIFCRGNQNKRPNDNNSLPNNRQMTIVGLTLFFSAIRC